jgi:hypothetical protein
MNISTVEKLADAVLYEGYLLYPYRLSAVKNQQRFNFGVLYPREYCDLQLGSDNWEMKTECLVLGRPSTTIEVKTRFLQLVGQPILAAAGFQPALFACEDVAFSHTRQEGRERQEGHTRQEGRERQGGRERQEGRERDVSPPPRSLESIRALPHRQQFVFTEAADAETLQGELELAALQLDESLFRLTLNVRNLARLEGARDLTRDQVLLRSLVSVHSILHVAEGEFVSLLDPPEHLKRAAADCQNNGAWPVLAGDEGHRDLVLSAPIILYDYPRIAPESSGDLFDGTEIDEILALRILTMTDAEKLEVRNGDDRARRILERTEMLPPEHFQKLHGALRGLRVSPEGPQ